MGFVLTDTSTTMESIRVQMQQLKRNTKLTLEEYLFEMFLLEEEKYLLEQAMKKEEEDQMQLNDYIQFEEGYMAYMIKLYEETLQESCINNL